MPCITPDPYLKPFFGFFISPFELFYALFFVLLIVSFILRHNFWYIVFHHYNKIYKIFLKCFPITVVHSFTSVSMFHPIYCLGIIHAPRMNIIVNFYNSNNCNMIEAHGIFVISQQPTHNFAWNLKFIAKKYQYWQITLLRETWVLLISMSSGTSILSHSNTLYQ